MRSLTQFADYVGYSLIFLTALSAAYAVIRRRDNHRINIFAFVTALLLAGLLKRPALPVLWTIGTALTLALPYFLLRLVRQFLDISPVVLHGSLIVAIVAGIALGVTQSLLSSAIVAAY